MEAVSGEVTAQCVCGYCDEFVDVRRGNTCGECSTHCVRLGQWMPDAVRESHHRRARAMRDAVQEVHARPVENLCRGGCGARAVEGWPTCGALACIAAVSSPPGVGRPTPPLVPQPASVTMELFAEAAAKALRSTRRAAVVKYGAAPVALAEAAGIGLVAFGAHKVVAKVISDAVQRKRRLPR